jgi:uncharacterized protein
MIKRTLEDFIKEDIVAGKVVLIYGARRVGKTFLLQYLADNFQGRVSFMNGDDFSTARMLSERTARHYQQLLSDTDLLIIDEAQNIREIGEILKLIVDEVKNVAVVATGSSSFDLYNNAGEPLVGRSNEFRLYPFSLEELLNYETPIKSFQKIEERVVFGLYPELELMADFNKKKMYLHEISNSYLLKDILMIDGIKNSSKMKDLLRLIALQTASIVSYDELGRQLSLSRNTVEKYLDLLTKTFVIYKLPAFSINPRKEISKSAKWMFFDTGIRNAVIGDFRPLSVRNDAGALWENFVISERLKYHNNKREQVQFYFWKSYSGQEIDLIEVKDTKIRAFELKLTKSRTSAPSGFINDYPDAEYSTINRENILSFIR